LKKTETGKGQHMYPPSSNWMEPEYMSHSSIYSEDYFSHLC